jgi:hypothetical protein
MKTGNTGASKLSLKTLELILRIVVIVFGGIWVLFHFWLTEFPKLHVTANVSVGLDLFEATDQYPHNATVHITIENTGLSKFQVTKINVMGRRFKGSPKGEEGIPFLDYDAAFRNGEQLFNQEFSTDGEHAYNGALLDRYPQGQLHHQDTFYSIKDLHYGDSIIVFVSVEYSSWCSHEITRALAYEQYKAQKTSNK